MPHKVKKNQKKTNPLTDFVSCVIDTEEKTCLAHEFCESHVHSFDYENICMLIDFNVTDPALPPLEPFRTNGS